MVIREVDIDAMVDRLAFVFLGEREKYLKGSISAQFQMATQSCFYYLLLANLIGIDMRILLLVFDF